MLPHCLKKNNAPCFSACSFIDNTHFSFIGRALIACSPPTITQSIFVKSSSPKSSTNGSHDRNLIEAGSLRRLSILCFISLASTDTPSQTFAGIARAVKYSAIRSARFVRIWYVCHGVDLITSITLLINSNGTSLWKRSLIEQTKIIVGSAHCLGLQSVSSCSVTLNPFSYLFTPFFCICNAIVFA